MRICINKEWKTAFEIAIKKAQLAKEPSLDEDKGAIIYYNIDEIDGMELFWLGAAFVHEMRNEYENSKG